MPDWVTTQTDDRGTPGQDPPQCADDAKITNTFLPTGWEQTRKLYRADTSCAFTALKQQTDWTYFDNGKVKTATTRNGSGSVLESHTVDYVDSGVYVNGNRVKDSFSMSAVKLSHKTK